MRSQTYKPLQIPPIHINIKRQCQLETMEWSKRELEPEFLNFYRPLYAHGQRRSIWRIYMFVRSWNNGKLRTPVSDEVDAWMRNFMFSKLNMYEIIETTFVICGLTFFRSFLFCFVLFEVGATHALGMNSCATSPDTKLGIKLIICRNIFRIYGCETVLHVPFCWDEPLLRRVVKIGNQFWYLWRICKFLQEIDDCFSSSTKIFYKKMNL